MADRKNISNRIRFLVFQRDHFACRYCGKTAQDGARLEIDHVEAVSKGGKSELDNYITACYECNRGKGNIEVLPNNKIPEGYELVRETKSKRCSFLLRPSTYKAMREYAKAKNQSVNDWLNDLIETCIQAYGKKVI